MRAQQRAWDAMAALEGVEKVRVTSAKGTDFTVTIKDRPALEVDLDQEARPDDGAAAAVGRGRVRRRRGRTDGTVVVDGVMLGIGLPGQVNEPITWTVEDGKAVKIEGGEDARRLREVVEGVENATVIGEFAFGVSEVAPFGTPSEKGRVGTVHCALGDNHNAYPGGQNVCVAAPRRRRARGLDADRRQRPLDPQGRRNGCCTRDAAGHDGHARGRRADPAARRQLEPDGADRQVARAATRSSLGYSVFTPGMRHGDGLPRDRGGRVRALGLGRAAPRGRRRCRSPPARACSSRQASGTRSPTPAPRTSIMVFGFPHPDYPPTQRKDARRVTSPATVGAR